MATHRDPTVGVRTSQRLVKPEYVQQETAIDTAMNSIEELLHIDNAMARELAQQYVNGGAYGESHPRTL